MRSKFRYTNKNNYNVDLEIDDSQVDDFGFNKLLERKIPIDARLITRPEVSRNITQTLNFTEISTDLLPLLDNTYTVGSASKKWFAGYFTNIYLGNPSVQLAATATQLNSLVDGSVVTLHKHNANDINITDSGGYYTGTEVETALQEIAGGGLTGTYLKLDQTTPQTVINGTPIFNVGLTSNSTVNITVPTLTKEALILQTTDDDTTKNLFEVKTSEGTSRLFITAEGVFSANRGATGTGDFFVGGAGNNSITGDYNFGMGGQALKNLTDGDYNIAIGGVALASVTTGDRNVGIGLQAGENTTGINNLFLGHQSGRYNGNGSSNVAIGYRAFGYGSGASFAGATNNFCFGDASGYNLGANADENLLIGSSSGYQLSGAASGNVMLGYKAGYSEIGVISNKLYISNSDTATPLIYGEFDGANGIGLKTWIPTATAVGWTIVGAASQSADYLSLIDSTTADVFKIDSDGVLWTTNKIVLTQTDGNEYIDSLADGYMDYRATTAHRFGDGTNQFIIESDGDTYWEGTGGLDFAQIYEEDGSSTLALAAQDTYYQVTAFSANGESNGMTPDHTNDHITVARTGKYLATIDISFYQTSAVAIEYDFHIKKNNGATDYPQVSAHRDSGGATTVGNTTSTGIISLTAGDTVELWVERLDGGAVSYTIGIVAAMLTLVQIGG